MGWKRFKEHFNISNHYIVELTKDGLAIGSGHIPGQVVINTSTGKIKRKDGFEDFLVRNLPAIQEATPEQLVSLFAEKDVFEKAIPVYAYKDGRIVQEFCEEVGWPNCTHKGELMYEGSHLPDKSAAVRRAKLRAALSVEVMRLRAPSVNLMRLRRLWRCSNRTSFISIPSTRTLSRRSRWL